MAELATIARPYAEALFKASASDLAGAAAWLDKVAAIAADPQLQQFADNPKATPEQVLGVIAGASWRGAAARGQQLPDGAARQRPLHGTAGDRPAVPRAGQCESGSSDAVVYSAFPIDDAALADVSAALEKRFGRKLQVTVQQDPSLIGGIRVVVGDEVLDTSVKARLEQMKVALAA